MRPIVVTNTGVGTSAWIPLDVKQAPFKVGIGCVVNGSATYNIEHTFDNVQDSTVTPTAFVNSGISNATGNKDLNYTEPVRAIRINQSVGAGSVTMTIIQSRR